MNTTLKLVISHAVWLLALPASYAGNVTIPNSFTSGTPAVAAQVNANFSAVEAEVDDNESRISTNAASITSNTSNIRSNSNDIVALQAVVAALQTSLNDANNTIASLQTVISAKADLDHNHDAQYALITHDHGNVYAPISHKHEQADVSGLTDILDTHDSQISAINNSEVMALDPYVSITNDSRGPIATFSGMNLKLVNGSGYTQSSNGLGNLIIGYDIPRSDSSYFCSDGTYTDQTSCEGASNTWAISHKTGSHYLVIGDRNNYSQFAAMLVGYQNTSNKNHASISGGTDNLASGSGASVSGGYRNRASGNFASISGGGFNMASGNISSISGGFNNTASGYYSSVSGGQNNTASGDLSSLSGGTNNTASHNFSSILGGNSQNTSSDTQTIPALP